MKIDLKIVATLSEIQNEFGTRNVSREYSKQIESVLFEKTGLKMKLFCASSDSGLDFGSEPEITLEFKN